MLQQFPKSLIIILLRLQKIVTYMFKWQTKWILINQPTDGLISELHDTSQNVHKNLQV